MAMLYNNCVHEVIALLWTKNVNGVEEGRVVEKQLGYLEIVQDNS